ncbi:MAG TPA: hypothetical protein VFC19_07875 [Candidatus Limnocylindrales bacterium]|nr:hypothetical protein [Candidatus Limnocylindrales bacterium]
MIDFTLMVNNETDTIDAILGSPLTGEQVAARNPAGQVEIGRLARTSYRATLNIDILPHPVVDRDSDVLNYKA